MGLSGGRGWTHGFVKLFQTLGIFSQDVCIHDIVFSVCKMFLRLQIIEINKICKPKGNNCLCEPNGIALREEKF